MAGRRQLAFRRRREPEAACVAWRARNARSAVAFLRRLRRTAERARTRGAPRDRDAQQSREQSTRRGERIYLHLLQRPYDTITVRGLPIRRVRTARELRTGTDLPFRTRCAVIDEMFNADPQGEVIITVPEAVLDPIATVVELEVSA